MIWYVLTAAVGVVLWAMLAPALWQVTLQDWADDAYELLKAWAIVAWEKSKPRIHAMANGIRRMLGS